jgi:hypothetical protein
MKRYIVTEEQLERLCDKAEESVRIGFVDEGRSVDEDRFNEAVREYDAAYEDCLQIEVGNSAQELIAELMFRVVGASPTARQLGATKFSMTISGSSKLDGWDCKIIIAPPGELDRDNDEDEE